MPTITFVALVTVIIGDSTFYPSPAGVPISMDTTHNGYFTTYNFPDITVSSVPKLGSVITIVHPCHFTADMTVRVLARKRSSASIPRDPCVLSLYIRILIK